MIVRARQCHRNVTPPDCYIVNLSVQITAWSHPCYASGCIDQECVQHEGELPPEASSLNRGSSEFRSSSRNFCCLYAVTLASAKGVLWQSGEPACILKWCQCVDPSAARARLPRLGCHVHAGTSGTTLQATKAAAGPKSLADLCWHIKSGAKHYNLHLPGQGRDSRSQTLATSHGHR